jgi:hypothetical protein
MEAVLVLTHAKDGDKAAKAHPSDEHLVRQRQASRSVPLQGEPEGMATRSDEQHDGHPPRTDGPGSVAHPEHRWAADIAAYDNVGDEILMMADTLANGIVAQFPSRFNE